MDGRDAKEKELKEEEEPASGWRREKRMTNG